MKTPFYTRSLYEASKYLYDFILDSSAQQSKSLLKFFSQEYLGLLIWTTQQRIWSREFGWTLVHIFGDFMTWRVGQLVLPAESVCFL